MILQKSVGFALLLCFFVQTSSCFLPVRVGHLASIHSDYSASGLVYLLDRTTIYVKDFAFNWDNTVPGLSLHLKGVSYHNNSAIPITDVGEGVVDSLECHTDSSTCCRGIDNPNGGGQGEWYYPDGTVVPRPAAAAGSNFYRTRDNGEIRLNRRGGQTPTGKYCCRLPTSKGETETICVDLVSDDTPSQEDAHFCVGYTPDSSTAVVMPLDESSIGFSSPYSRPHLHIRLPNTRGINHLEWVGVCTSSAILARITLHPSVTLKLPCEAKLLGDLPSTGGEGVSGRVYLVNRVTFAVLGFNYQDSNGNDAVFLSGAGTPSVSGYQLTSYTDDVSTSLGVTVDQDCLVNIPESAEGVKLTYLSVWSRSRNQALSTVTFSGDTVPPLPPPIPGVRINNFYMRLHQISGTGYALNETHLYLQRFNYDGTAPAVTFRAIRGTHYLTATEYADMFDERGNMGNLRAYNFEDIVISLPNGYTMNDTDQIIIWCDEFKTSFGELVFPDRNISFVPNSMEMIQPPPPTPLEVCPPLKLEETRNCKRLHSDLTMSWVLDEQHDQLTVELCGCNVKQDELYVAFGLSGSNSRIQMFNSDPVWAWLDNTGVHAQELAINAYSQCNFRTGSDGVVTQTGACPEATSNVVAVSGHVEGCTACFKFNRPIRASDGQDKAITPGHKQWVVWAIGPVGTLVTPTGSTIPIPFKHYLRPEYTENLEIDFGRVPLDECGTSVCSCKTQAPLLPWRQERLEHTTTVSVRIGQSGGKRGYAGITGIVGWGISIYLNETLIPSFTVYRGVTYTFVVETGDNPENPARYHPFYITSSERGGYSTLSAEDQKKETVYAGRDSNGNWLGVGRFCFYGPVGADLADDKSSFPEYKKTLSLQCDQGEPGTFTWTPDEDTPDTVYYQCASHQYLGWKIKVVEPPPEFRPIEINVASFSPMVVGDSVEFIIQTSKRAESVSCQLLNKDTGVPIPNDKCVNKFGNSYTYNRTRLSPASYELRVTVNKNLEDETIFKRSFDIFSDPMSCGVYLRDEDGVVVDKTTGVLTIDFGASGLYDSFSCTTNDKPTVCGTRRSFAQYTSSGVTLKSGWNKICVRTEGCEGSQRKNMAVYFNQQTGDVITAGTNNCSSHSIDIDTAPSPTSHTPLVYPTPSSHMSHTSTAAQASTHETHSGTTSEQIMVQVSTDPGMNFGTTSRHAIQVTDTTHGTNFGSTSGHVIHTTSVVNSQTGTTLGQATSHVLRQTTVVSSSEVVSPASVLNEQVSSTAAVRMTSTGRGVAPTPTVIPGIKSAGGIGNGSPKISSSVVSLLLSGTLAIVMATIACQ